MRRAALAFALIASSLLSGPADAQVNGVAMDASKGVLLLGSPAGAANCKTATKGGIRYNSTTPQLEYCDGTTWKTLIQTADGITAPAGTGYFVMSYGAFNGDTPGSLAGADSACLTDLTTHTSWRGYSTANSNGQLVSGKVHAFACDQSICNNLIPATTYYFASGADSSAGGASFTTNSNGAGPNDNMNWAAANYFSGTYSYWTARDSGGSSTAWSPTGFDNSGWANCNSYSAWWLNAQIGTSTATDSGRWNVRGVSCNGPLHLICFVDP